MAPTNVLLLSQLHKKKASRHVNSDKIIFLYVVSKNHTPPKGIYFALAFTKNKNYLTVSK